jgi:excisionase family DNA binding protein
MTPKQPFQPGRLLTPSEVAELFGVDPKTITRWDKAGKLPAGIRTLGGHRRWHETDIRAMLDGDEPQRVNLDDEPSPGRVRTLDTPWWDQ